MSEDYFYRDGFNLYDEETAKCIKLLLDHGIGTLLWTHDDHDCPDTIQIGLSHSDLREIKDLCSGSEGLSQWDKVSGAYRILSHYGYNEEEDLEGCDLWGSDFFEDMEAPSFLKTIASPSKKQVYFRVIGG